MPCDCDKQRELAVQGDARPAVVMKETKVKGPVRDILLSLLTVLRCMTNEHQLDMRDAFAQLGELERRLK